MKENIRFAKASGFWMKKKGKVISSSKLQKTTLIVGQMVVHQSCWVRFFRPFNKIHEKHPSESGRAKWRSLPSKFLIRIHLPHVGPRPKKS